MAGFIFGGNTPWTYEELKRQREIASALAVNTSAPRNVGEGLTAIGNALAYRGLTKRAGKEEARMKGEFDDKWGSVFGGYGSGNSAASGGGGTPSGTWTPAAPAPSPVDVATHGLDVAKAGGLSFGDKPKADTGVLGAGKEPLDFGAAVMTPQEMLIEGAKRRGLDPIDVATAISYETGGKFDPTLSGPTTQWGTHRGLIQFGEPQAKQHGVDFSNPDAAWRSQLNPENGAIWSYLDGAGVKPGMGLSEIYSGINAGSVGRMGASDANNGGAPGTVADKVAGMGPHRENAAKFLGGTWTPNPDAGGGQGVQFADASGGFPPGMDIGALIGLAGDPMASPAQKAIVEMLIQQQMQTADPMAAIELEKAQLELDALKNPTQDPMDAIELEKAEIELARLKNPAAEIPETLQERRALAREAGLVDGTPEYQKYIATGELVVPGGGSEYGLTPVLGRDKDGNVVVMQLGKDGTAVQTQMPDGVTADLGLAAEVKAEGAAVGKAKGEDEALLSSTASKMEGLETVVSELEGLADQATYTFGGQLYDAGRKQLGMAPRDAAVARAEYIAKVDNQVLPMLRDTFGSAFTVKEGETLRATLGDPDKSPQEKKAVLRAFIEQKKRDIEALEQRTGKSATGSPGSAAPVAIGSDQEYDALPSGTMFVGPDGKTRRKP